MSLPTYLFIGWALVLVAEAAFSARRSFSLWRRKRAFRRLAGQLRRCAELHPIPNARTWHISGE